MEPLLVILRCAGAVGWRTCCVCYVIVGSVDALAGSFKFSWKNGLKAEVSLLGDLSEIVDLENAEGLTLAWKVDIRVLVIELVLLSLSQVFEWLATVMLCSFSILNQDWQVFIRRVHRKANFSAEWMANYAATFPVGVDEFSSAPSGILDCLRNDVCGAGNHRLQSVEQPATI
ncbi:conserved hypothetical protein [Ricinus communis]|uniref:RNase H type-1 domain-containing protein n=1 Tax=Ricinus communis TaxID=3988 RepID=B9R9I4_RICCO|nr:conserved hypothetical protein [Ricinus communis]